MNFLSSFLSGVMHPLLLPSYIFSLIFLFFPEVISPVNEQMYMPLFLIVLISTALLPALMVVVLYRMNLVEKINIEDRTDRFIPQLVSCFIYAFVTWIFYTRLAQVPNIYLVMLSISMCMLLVTVTNFFWKISAHSTGMGGMVSFFIFCTYYYGDENLVFWLCLAIVMAGLVMASRLFLQVHTLGQVCAGFMLGLSTGLIVLGRMSGN